jgi:hypothetical protein
MENKIKEIKQTHCQATHLLKCRHCVGTNRCRDYSMKCIPVGKTKSGKLKIIVFGDMGWKDKEHIKKIRYVDESRVYKI